MRFVTQSMTPGSEVDATDTAGAPITPEVPPPSVRWSDSLVGNLQDTWRSEALRGPLMRGMAE